MRGNGPADPSPPPAERPAERPAEAPPGPPTATPAALPAAPPAWPSLAGPGGLTSWAREGSVAAGSVAGDVRISYYGGPPENAAGDLSLTTASTPLAVPQRRVPSARLRGRETLVEELTAALAPRGEGGTGGGVNDGGAPPGVWLLSGMGGCGKTTVALELAHRLDGAMAHVWWVSGADAEGLTAALRAVAFAAGAVPADFIGAHPADALWKRLASLAEPWLLILDNVDDPAVLAAAPSRTAEGNGWLRPPGPLGRVLVTSRESRAERWGRWVRTVDVEPLAGLVGAQVLTDLAPRAGGQADARDLAEHLGGLPLALDLAGTYLARALEDPWPSPATPGTFSAYRRSLDTRLADMASDRDADLGPAERTRRTILSTWELSLDLLHRQGADLARPLLRLLCAFGPAPLPYLDLLDLDLLKGSPVFPELTLPRFQEALRGLAGLGLVSIETADDTADSAHGAAGGTRTHEGPARSASRLLTLHPLVRAASRAHPAFGGQAHELLRLVSALLQHATGSLDVANPAHWPRLRVIAPHGSAALPLLAACQGVGETVVRDVVVAATEPAVRTASYRLHAGLFGEGVAEIEAAGEVRTRLLGEEDPATIAAGLALAWALRSSGDLMESDALYERLTAVCARGLPADHPYAGSVRTGRARTLTQLGRYEAAEAELRVALAMRLADPRRDSRSVLRVRTNLARIAHNRGRYAEAAESLREIRELTREHAAEGELDALSVGPSLVRALRDAGHQVEAEAVAAEVVAEHEAVLPPYHPAVLIARHERARLLRDHEGDRGRLERARDEFTEIALLSRRWYGADHPDTIAIRHELAAACHLLGDLDRAAAHFAAVWEAGRRRLGESHPHVVTCGRNLAAVRRELAARTGAAPRPAGPTSADAATSAGPQEPPGPTATRPREWPAAAAPAGPQMPHDPAAPARPAPAVAPARPHVPQDPPAGPAGLHEPSSPAGPGAPGAPAESRVPSPVAGHGGGDTSEGGRTVDDIRQPGSSPSPDAPGDDRPVPSPALARLRDRYLRADRTQAGYSGDGEGPGYSSYSGDSGASYRPYGYASHRPDLFAELAEPAPLDPDDVRALARGEDDRGLVERLWVQHRAARLLILRDVLDGTAELLAGRHDEIPAPDSVRALLTRADHANRQAVSTVLLHPTVGRWISRALRLLRDLDGAAPDALPADLLHLHCVAAAVAVRAGIPFELQLPVRDGHVFLPTLGAADVRSAGEATALIEQSYGPTTLTCGQLTVRVATSTGGLVTPPPGWHPTPRLRAPFATGQLDLLLEDMDPHRETHGLTPPAPADAADVEEWGGLARGAASTLSLVDPRQAAALGVALRSLTPRPPDPSGTVNSVTSSDAFGGLVASLPPNGTELAATLVHEFRHMKLNSVLDTTALHEEGEDVAGPSGAVYYAPWRTDPRPLPGFLHGVFAFVGVVDFWRKVAATAEGSWLRRAQFQWQYWSTQTRDAFTELRASEQLTQEGKDFVALLGETVAGWTGEALVVPDDVAVLAGEAVTAHRVRWRLRHLRPDAAAVAEFAGAWLAGADRAPGATVPVTLHPNPDAAPSIGYTALLCEVAAAAGAAPGTLDPADQARLRGALDEARRLSAAQVPADPGHDDPWVRLTLSLRGARPALTRHPELVRAVHTRLTTTAPEPPDPATLAAWLDPEDEVPAFPRMRRSEWS